jgi:hypothetical protein
MTMISSTTQQIIEQVSCELGTLPYEDLVLVKTFVTYLKEQQPMSVSQTSLAAIRIAAQRRAAELQNIPRTELVEQFQRLAEDIRQQAIRQGTAIEGDWERD